MDSYLIVKSLHIISVISWMAGMLYLPRLYVYHAGAVPGSEMDLTFQTMERRLLRFIINPAMIATFLFGIVLVAQLGVAGLGGWFHAKILLVVLLTVLHGLFSIWRKAFVAGKNTHSARFYRLINEVPTVAMIAIVFLVVVKPF